MKIKRVARSRATLRFCVKVKIVRILSVEKIHTNFFCPYQKNRGFCPRPTATMCVGFSLPHGNHVRLLCRLCDLGFTEEPSRPRAGFHSLSPTCSGFPALRSRARPSLVFSSFCSPWFSRVARQEPLPIAFLSSPRSLPTNHPRARRKYPPEPPLFLVRIELRKSSSVEWNGNSFHLSRIQIHLHAL